MADYRVKTWGLVNAFLYEAVRLSSAYRTAAADRSEPELHVLHGLATQVREVAELLVPDLLRLTRYSPGQYTYHHYLTQLTVRTYPTLARLHAELGVIPAPPPRVELTAFLQDVWHQLVPDASDRDDPEDLPSRERFTMWPALVETRALWQSQTPLANARNVWPLRFPRLDASSPLFWPLLAHELAHRFLRMHGPAIGFDRFDPSGFHRWRQEVLCDLIATRILGPSFLAAMAVADTFVVNRRVVSFEPTHPATIYRLNFIRNYLLQTEGPLPQWLDFLVCHIDALAEVYKSELPPESEGSDYALLRDSYQELAAIARSIPLVLSAFESRPKGSTLLGLLSSGLPIGTVSPSADDRKRDDLNSNTTELSTRCRPPE